MFLLRNQVFLLSYFHEFSKRNCCWVGQKKARHLCRLSRLSRQIEKQDCLQISP